MTVEKKLPEKPDLPDRINFILEGEQGVEEPGIFVTRTRKTTQKTDNEKKENLDDN